MRHDPAARRIDFRTASSYSYRVNVSLPLRWLCIVTAGLWLVTLARAEKQAGAAAVYADGLAAEEKVNADDTPAARRADLSYAVEKYRRVVLTRPDFQDARRHLSSCLLSLASLSATRQEQRDYIDAAGEQLDWLAGASAATVDDQLRRADFLRRYRYDTAASPEAKQKAFDLLQPVYRAAVEKAASPATRATAEVRLADLLTMQADATPGGARVGDWYRQSATLFETATRVSPELLTPERKFVWGVALLNNGRLDHDPATVRHGLQLVEESLQGQRGDVSKRYNLACAHAVLGEQDKALELLAGCLKDDAKHLVYQTVQTDPDWAKLRESPAFVTLMQRHDPAVDKLFDEAVADQSAGERTTIPAVRTDYLRKACQKYLEVIRSRPDFYRAHLNALNCLLKLWALTQPAREKETLFAAIHEQFQAGARSPGADWSLWYRYGNFLLQQSQRSSGEPAVKLLRESKAVLEEANRRVAFKSDRAQVASLLAQCDVFLARQLTDPSAQRPLLEQSLKHFEESIQIERLASTPEVYAAWGVAQLDLAKLDGDRFGIHRAIERFQTALKSDPRLTLALYNIACAYSLLGQGDDAIRYLGQYVQFETDGHSAALAATDPDFRSLRTRDDFKKLFTSTYDRRFSIDQPAPLSGR